MRAVLWGRDHTELGITAVEKVDGGVALALSRGRHRKAYAYTDPNEDAVATVVGPRATVLVLADGHNGWPATEAAVQAVLDELGDDPPPADLTDDEMAALFWRAQQAVVACTQRRGSDAPESRTTLVVALLAGRRLQWGSFGDSAVYVAGPAAATRLPAPRHRFIGYRDMPRWALPDLLERGRTDLHDNQWLIVASDGFSDFAHPFPTALLAGGPDAAVVAQGLIDAAFDGGAGDNVAVGVVAP
ncbi:MAG: protein phosphatase 2C domain-containing protein [Actinomycetota bacterium]|jgi:serine/threonine protein phosphatase PrpC|nr:protein phosphatase 2C domain-containing protein [Actinomycetota bacterium]